MIWLESSDGLWSRSPFNVDDILTHDQRTAGQDLPPEIGVLVVVDNSGNIVTSGI